ncbi:MAG: hypothetical protein ACK4YQ_15425 [Phenylobacterium sp.]|uniref:hypothetical protein n=1 Tax=Phenylobacterium sp. TaxID=1871053 RepID=UPI00391BCD17
MRSRSWCAALAAAAAAAAFATGHAAEAPPEPAAPASAPSPSPPPTLSPADLEAETAGDVNVMSSQQLTATNSGNSITADTVQSGDIALTDSAFSGFSGVGNFVFNTGANNNLQGVVSVNIVGSPGL